MKVTPVPVIDGSPCEFQSTRYEVHPCSQSYGAYCLSIVDTVIRAWGGGRVSDERRSCVAIVGRPHVAGSVGFAPHNVVRAPSRAEKGLAIGAGIYVNAVLQNDAAPVQPPTVDSEPRFMLIPPPVKFIAFLAGSFEAMPQLGALMFGLPWKLIEPVNAKTHGGFVTTLYFGNGCRGYIDSGQTKHCCQVCWLLLANSGLNESSGRPVP